MQHVVEINGERFSVALPDAVVSGEAFPLKVGRERFTAVWYRHLGSLSLTNAAGVERLVRLRMSRATRTTGDLATSVQIEASLGAAGMATFAAAVQPDLPGQEARARAAAASEQIVRSQITGKVLQVLVASGDSVASGQALLIIEAMKMENRVFATAPGTVSTIQVKDGDAVQAGRELLRISP